LIYLNNAATSWPKPVEVAEAVTATMEAGPESYSKSFQEARKATARLLGIDDTKRLLLTPGCTTALSIAIQDLPWESGDTVITSSLEHHALIRPVQSLALTRGVEHLASPYRPGEPFDLEFLENQLRSRKVRLVAVTAASNVTGELLPIREITRLAHEQGALVLVDAAQTAGIIPLAVEAVGIDILVFAGHKGPLGPQGIGALWAAPEVLFQSPDASCDLEQKQNSAAVCNDFPGYCDVGSVNAAGAAGLAAGIRWHLNNEKENLGSSQRDLASRLVHALSDMPLVNVFGGKNAERTAAVSIRIEPLPVSKAEGYFREQGIIVRAGRHCAPMALHAIGAPEGTIRVSFGPFNTESDLQQIVVAIRSAASMP
jgi:cysteine desulfurase/selenocysteine lyase